MWSSVVTVVICGHGFVLWSLVKSCGQTCGHFCGHFVRNVIKSRGAFSNGKIPFNVLIIYYICIEGIMQIMRGI